MASERPGEEKPTEEQAEQAVADAIRGLDERWMWMRDLIGESRWHRLVRWRRAWLALWWVWFAAGGVTAYLALILGIAVLVNLARGNQPLTGVHLEWLHLLAPIVLVVSWLARKGVRPFVVAEFERLMWEGRNPEAVEEALWADHEARELEGRKHDILQGVRLEREKTAGPRWWRLELSGTHFLLWLALVVAVVGPRSESLVPRTVWMPAAAVALIGGIAKGSYWVLWLAAGATTRRGLLRTYRWCGTLRGTLAIVVVVPLALLTLMLLTELAVNLVTR